MNEKKGLIEYRSMVQPPRVTGLRVHYKVN